MANEIQVALFGLVGVLIGALLTYRINNKQVMLKIVTEERAKWREELRNIYSEFERLVYEQLNNSNASNKPRIHELKSHIKLRVNPDPKHALDHQILTFSQLIVDQLDSNQVTKEKIITNLLNLEGEVQQLLKNEWDKSKKEAITGKPDATKNSWLKNL